MDEVSVVLNRLLSLHPKEIDLSLARMYRLLAALGHPEERLPPVIHIAGTNGKGSTTATMRAILEAAGHRVHVYTSPHLVNFNERIRVAGALVSDEMLVAALKECERVNGAEEITFFEVTTAAALLLFSQTPADVLLLEVGLGGRLDATNVVDTPMVTVITPISMDHESYLGATLREIALEKAGILKPGVPAVIGPQEDEALEALMQIAAQTGAPIEVFSENFLSFEEHGRFVFQNEDGLLDLKAPILKGHHQVVNSGVALAALDAVDLLPAAQIIEHGFERVNWPGRMQRLNNGPILDLFPCDAEIWLDGGHNPGASLAIAGFLGEQEEIRPRPLYLIAGMMKTKDPIGYFRSFKGLAKHAVTVPLTTTTQGRSSYELAAAAAAAGLKATPCDDLQTAFSSISQAFEKDREAPRILICGSLYLAGEILDLNQMRPD